ncbi:MAG: hydrogenase maturation nickel metallochaperone HypA [Leptolyngbyaceae bacterium]|nr:hydrogenase maturation nickel metallochaperone HypA [Leptolyngbyaceae bacterium]
MHETDMTKALIVTLTDWWEAQPQPAQISSVHLIVGQFTCVEPMSLQFAYEVQTRNTFLEGSKLVIRETPLIAFCDRCQQEYTPEIGVQYACPTCHAPMEEIRSGRELKIDRIEYCSTTPSNASLPPSNASLATTHASNL